MQSTLTTSSSAEQLRETLSGRVMTQADGDYDEARRVFFGDLEKRPGIIARVANAADVARVISIARDTGHELAVRSGGHSAAGHSTTEGGVVLDLRDMNGIEIDAGERTAWAETGLTAREFSNAAAAHRLALGFGDMGSVGIGGITLGGGVGYLVRKHGLTIDHLLAAEIVTADGQLRHADADTNADLFWAIRGGSGNFGVATRFRCQLHPVDTVLGGVLILPATPDVIERFIAESEAAPE
ncbi:MAG: FAD-binding oxidoreductase [Chloroflexota bacterium]|nr:FAD-binding oxidoreductase [Chloroflexota bacterium]